MTIGITDVTGLILAGGRATRMGGVDKGLQQLNGEPLVTHVLQRLRPQVSSIMINANRHLDTYRAFGVPVYGDELQGFAGPLAGIHAGLAQCRTPYMVTAPCDSPRLPADLVAHLSAALTQGDSDVAVAATGHGAALQRHPVFMLVKTTLLPVLASWLADGGRKVDDWLSSLRCAEAIFNDETAFENINTTEHLGDMARRLR